MFLTTSVLALTASALAATGALDSDRVAKAKAASAEAKMVVVTMPALQVSEPGTLVVLGTLLFGVARQLRKKIG